MILKCKEATTFQRIIKYDEIKAEYERLMEIRLTERKKLRDENREKRLAELQAEAGEDKTQEDIAADMEKWEED